jgi:hypothetical protein
MILPLPDNLNAPDGLAQLAHAKRATRASGPMSAGDCSHELTETDGPQTVHASVSPLQFRLRTMLATVAALCGLFAVMHFVGAVWSSILVWFLLLVIAHVTANCWGTRIAPRVCQSADEPEPYRPTVTPGYAASGAVRLSESLRPGWPMFVATAVGAIVGGSLGGAALALLSLDRAGYAGVVVGSVSAAAVGGFLGFLTSSFAEIALRAWKEALAGSKDRD